MSSLGAARFGRLCDVTLPVSLHVLEAGDGGGGISKRSEVSLLMPVDFDEEADDTTTFPADVVGVVNVVVGATVTAGVGVLLPDDFSRSFKSFDVRLLNVLLLGNGGIVTNLKRQISVKSHAALSN